MARRARKMDTTQTQENPETTNTEESAVSTTAPEADATAEATTEAPTPEATEEKAKEVDLTAFSEVVEAAIAEADQDTGTVPEASVASVSAAYRELDGIKAKNAAKRYVNELMKDAMNSGNLPRARSSLQLHEQALVATGGGAARAERQPADPTEAAVQRVGTLRLATELAVVPEGVSDDYEERLSKFVDENRESVQSYLDWMQASEDERGDEPETTPVVKAAAKLAAGKSARAGGARVSTASGSGERHDTGAHIVHAFEGKDEGTFLAVAEIRNTPSPEYGDLLPSAGAISARLFPKDKDGNPTESSMVKFGIIPTTRDGKKGAVKQDAS